MSGWRQCLWLSSLVVVVSGCAGNSGSGSDVDLLDPTQPQYGKTYSEWASEWASYRYMAAPPACSSPFTDETGEDCRSNQDPTSPVFFLVGVFGGLARRSACPIPKDKALFFPIFEAMGDNAGLPPQDVRPDSDVLNFMTEVFKQIDPSQLWLVVDGRKISRLERGAVPPTRYVVTLQAGQNTLACAGLPEAEGDFPGYIEGYWAMLPPLPPGPHRLAFGATLKTESTALNTQILDVEYTFNL
jgi:hypothetical protein